MGVWWQMERYVFDKVLDPECLADGVLHGRLDDDHVQGVLLQDLSKRRSVANIRL
jgi:hypothetical protein